MKRKQNMETRICTAIVFDDVLIILSGYPAEYLYMEIVEKTPVSIIEKWC